MKKIIRMGVISVVTFLFFAMGCTNKDSRPTIDQMSPHEETKDLNKNTIVELSGNAPEIYSSKGSQQLVKSILETIELKIKKTQFDLTYQINEEGLESTTANFVAQREQVLGGDYVEMTMDSKNFGDQVVIKSFDPQFFKIMVSVYRKDVGMAIFAFKRSEFNDPRSGRSRPSSRYTLIGSSKISQTTDSTNELESNLGDINNELDQVETKSKKKK